MRLFLLFAMFSLGFLRSGASETIEFQSDDDVLIVRIIDMFGTAKTEFIGQPGQYYQCVAIDEANQPIGVTTATTELGALFQDLQAASISKVVCRKV